MGFQKDPSSGAAYTISLMHALANEGKVFTYSHLIAHGSELANDGTLIITIVANETLHLTGAVVMEKFSDVVLYEDSVVNVEGTPVTPTNVNRTSSEALTSTFAPDTTLTDNGTTLVSWSVPAGSGPSGGGGIISESIGWVLDSGKTYSLQITNRGGAVSLGSVVLMLTTA